MGALQVRVDGVRSPWVAEPRGRWLSTVRTGSGPWLTVFHASRDEALRRSESLAVLHAGSPGAREVWVAPLLASPPGGGA